MNRMMPCLLLSFAMLTGCASLDKQPYLVTKGNLSAENQLVLARPMELGTISVGDATGEAHVTKLFFITIDGDKTKASLPLLGNVVGDPLERLAASRAIDSVGDADAMYITRTTIDDYNFLYIYTKREVRVEGKALALQYLGSLSPERADTLRINGGLGGGGGGGVMMNEDGGFLSFLPFF